MMTCVILSTSTSDTCPKRPIKEQKRPTDTGILRATLMMTCVILSTSTSPNPRRSRTSLCALLGRKVPAARPRLVLSLSLSVSLSPLSLSLSYIRISVCTHTFEEQKIFQFFFWWMQWRIRKRSCRRTGLNTFFTILNIFLYNTDFFFGGCSEGYGNDHAGVRGWIHFFTILNIFFTPNFFGGCSEGYGNDHEGVRRWIPLGSLWPPVSSVRDVLFVRGMYICMYICIYRRVSVSASPAKNGMSAREKRKLKNKRNTPLYVLSWRRMGWALGKKEN